MRARESSGLHALFPPSPAAVARDVCWRDGGGAPQGVMAEEGAHGPARMLHRLGASQCRTDQPSNASGSGLCTTVTGSLSRWPARCWVRVRGKAVGNACTASRQQAAALIAPAQRPGGRGAAGGGKGRVHGLYSVRGTRAAGPHHARDATLRGRGAPGRRTPAARARAGVAGRWARAAGGGCPAGSGADTEEGARARRARGSDPGCAGSGAPTAAAAGHGVAAALTRAPPSGLVVPHGGPASGARSSLWMPTSPTSHAPTAQSAGKEIPC
jgi:hypothetical protein